MKKSTIVLLLFILAKFILQWLAVHPDFDLHRDEYLHLDQAKHLAWGYLSVPPLTSWISLLIEFLGGGEFWVRFFPALIGVLTLVLVWDLVKRIGGNLFAQCLAAMALLCSALIRLNILFQPNSVDILCYTLVFYTLIRYFLESDSKWLYLMAISFAIGLLNKYNIAFLGLGLLPALLIGPQRRIFQNKHLYFSILLLVLLISANLLWQWQNGFPVLTHMELLRRTQLVNSSRIGFLSQQLLFFYPTIPLWIAGLLFLWFGKSTHKLRFVAWSYLFTMAIFTYFQAKGYYAIGLYPVLLAFGAVWLSGLLEKFLLKKRSESSIQFTWYHLLILLIPPALFYPSFSLIHPVFSSEKLMSDPPNYAALDLNRWEDGELHPIPQDFADMLGWSELAALVDEAYAQMPKEGRIMIICDNYGQAGAINFYSKTKGLEVLTMNADYLYWFDLEEPVEHLILVWEKDEKISERELNFFEEYREIGKISLPLAREIGTTVHYLRGAKTDINAILREEVKEEKKIWERTSDEP